MQVTAGNPRGSASTWFGLLAQQDGQSFIVDPEHRAKQRLLDYYVSFDGVPNEASNITGQLVATSLGQECNSTLYVWLWDPHQWRDVNGGFISTTGTTLTFDLSFFGVPASSAVSGDSGPGQVRVRVRCWRLDKWKPAGFSLASDQLAISY